MESPPRSLVPSSSIPLWLSTIRCTIASPNPVPLIVRALSPRTNGWNSVDDFYQLTRKAATEVYALLNISRVGLIAQNELANMANIDAAAVKQAVQRHPDFIVGLKARMSSSVVGENGITPLARAKAIQQENDDLPLMVHIGNNPPNLDEIADLLSSGDIITHCYNGKPNRILNPAGELRSSITRALQRGVRLDVGHGTASFSFEVARRAIALGILPHTISSDIYCRNRIDGPVRSLALVMSKFLAIGMTLPQVIDCVTVSAAEGLRLSGWRTSGHRAGLRHKPVRLQDDNQSVLLHRVSRALNSYFPYPPPQCSVPDLPESPVQQAPRFSDLNRTLC